MSVQLPLDKIPTGDSVSYPQTRYSFTAPSDAWIRYALEGMMSLYADSSTWVQVGSVTVEQAASIFGQLFLSFGVDMATTGAIVPFAGGVLPSGWIPCDGRSLAVVDYPSLFAAIGNVWGAVDSSHFNIPDLRGRVLVGQGTGGGGTYALGASGGEVTHTLDTTEMPSHAHTDLGHTHAYDPATPSVTVPGELPVPVPSAVPGIALTASGSANLTSTGGGLAHNNLQPYGVINYAIIS